MTSLTAVSERAFASALETMTDEGLFELMAELEIRSGAMGRLSPADEIFAQIVLTESAIERRFPGRMLKPYRDWQVRRMRRDCA
ncbi:hypothetical protein GA0061105_105205 [Rhizobium aethiopicum]|uniref:Uncharacterized protein n=1 Tax=Rhizobium aethiopicum TaxID=1138170 RepID=A0A1C3Y2V9_9HYPH|nr:MULTISPECIES: hypothetical protein [Rhizobium]SCB58736.1 hypothetical protein GA0061105_105205 [Rhizobium aethiopicum]